MDHPGPPFTVGITQDLHVEGVRPSQDTNMVLREDPEPGRVGRGRNRRKGEPVDRVRNWCVDTIDVFQGGHT